MIKTEQIQKLVSALKSQTLSAVRENQRCKVPLVLEGIKTSRTYESETESEYEDNLAYDELNFSFQYNYLVNMRKYHYDDKWYYAIDSVDYPYKSFGVIRVNDEKMPYRSFESLMNKKSFIMRLDGLIYQGLCEPVMIFINRKFVNWYNIDVVYDCGDTYLLLHGTEYTYFKLSSAKLNMIILPFSVDYIGVEDDEYWQLYYNMLLEYLQESLYLTSAGKLAITVPTITSEYRAATMVYGVGAWMYTQMRLYKLGLLSDSRAAKLKKMNLTYYEYDDSGNVNYSYITKFNALDIDSFDKDWTRKIYHMDYDNYISRALMRFDEDGTMNQTSGELIISLLDESLYTNYYLSSDKYVYYQQADLNKVLFRENYLVFKNGLFYPEQEIQIGVLNTIRIDNPETCNVELFTFCPNGLEDVITVSDCMATSYLANIMLEYADANKYIDQGIDAYEFYNDIIQNIFKQIDTIYNDDSEFTFTPSVEDVVSISYEDAERLALLTQFMDTLDYSFLDSEFYKDNIQSGIDAIMSFDPKLFNPLYHTNVRSKVLTGVECNNNLVITFDYETRRGLKIPRYKYKNHETYVMVFVNGELIDTYYKMLAFANFFLIPLESEEFNDSDVVELLFFIDINNNEISFKLTEDMIANHFSASSDDLLLKVDIFNQYIKSDELKIFCDYPSSIINYPELIKEVSDSVSYNISCRLPDDDNLYVYADTIDISNNNIYTAVSSRKFIYERLYPDQISYRLKIDDRFRFCDNQKQYMLFINGRRIEDEGFLITIPKFSRPFWAMYLYTAKFVGPNDRVELFYVPYEVMNTNTEKEPVTFDEKGYIEANKQNLKVPYDTNLYTYYINGKKLPSTWITGIDTYTVRVNQDTKSLLHLVINKSYRDTLDFVIDYMKSDNYSTYDALIKQIKDTTYLKYNELDNLFNVHVSMTNTEEDMIAWDTGPIAIINEIVRDFWVTSGYQYNDVVKFIYDYALDEYIEDDEENGFKILPSLDARQYINIPKNGDMHLLYYIHNPEELIWEIGSSISNIILNWEYSTPLFGEWLILHQYMNSEEIDKDLRQYTDPDEYFEDVTYALKASTSSGILEASITYHFYNGIYYGNVDEDSLQWFLRDIGELYIDDLVAVIPNNGKVSTKVEQEDEVITLLALSKNNSIISDIDVIIDETIEETSSIWDSGDLINLNDESIYAICDECGVIEGPIEVTNGWGISETPVIEYFNNEDLQYLLPRLQYKVLQDTVTIDITNYIWGNDNYFVFAAPYRLCFENGVSKIQFVVPDINADEVINAGYDDHTVPIYTNGRWDDSNQLIKLDECKMVYMGEFSYTNPSGYTEIYCIWRSNGFFSRLYEDYEFEFHVRDKTEVEEIQTVFTAEDFANDTESNSTIIAQSLSNTISNYTDDSEEVILLNNISITDE